MKSIGPVKRWNYWTVQPRSSAKMCCPALRLISMLCCEINKHGPITCLHLFYDVSPSEVFVALRTFYTQKGLVINKTGHDEDESLTLREPNGGWTVVELDRGWALQRDMRREAQLSVSRQLSCSGFLIRVYDGNFWEYELFKNGELLDHFVQEVETSEGRPPGTDAGDVEAIVSVFPWLKANDVAPYLIQENWDDPEERLRLDVRARPGDEFTRFDECSVLDFLRLLGVEVSLVDHYVTLGSPVAKQFWIKSYDY